MPTRNFILRSAAPQESGLVHEFYRTYPDKNVLPRPEADLKASAEKGLFFVAYEEDRLVGVSGVFDLGEIAYVELGGTLVHESARGLKLQLLLFQLRIAAVVVNQGPHIQMLTAIDPSNGPSGANTLKSGFEAWSDPVPEVLTPCVTCDKQKPAREAGRPCCCDFFLLPEREAKARVKELLDETTASPSFEWKGAKVEIRSNLVVDQRDMLTDYLKGMTW